MLPSGISSTPTSNCTSEGDLPVWGDLLGSLLAVRAGHHDHVRELGGSLEQRLHRLPDGRVGHTRVGLEHDRRAVTGPGRELLLPEVESLLRLRAEE
jgi:hypothetical protein